MEANLFLEYNIRTEFLKVEDYWEPLDSCSLPAAVIEQDAPESGHCTEIRIIECDD